MFVKAREWSPAQAKHRRSDCQEKIRRSAHGFFNPATSTFQMLSGRPAIPGPYLTSARGTNFASSLEMSGGAAGETRLTSLRPGSVSHLERVPQNMLQRFESELFPFDQMIPSEREAL